MEIFFGLHDYIFLKFTVTTDMHMYYLCLIIDYLSLLLTLVVGILLRLCIAYEDDITPPINFKYKLYLIMSKLNNINF